METQQAMQPNFDTKLLSAHEIGEQCELKFEEEGMVTTNAYVKAVTFTNGKVRYSVFLRASGTTLHNVDSTFVKKISDPEMMDFGFDNYS